MKDDAIGCASRLNTVWSQSDHRNRFCCKTLQSIFIFILSLVAIIPGNRVGTRASILSLVAMILSLVAMIGLAWCITTLIYKDFIKT